MMGGAAAIAGGLGLAVKTAAGFESSMNRVGAVSGATGESFESLKDQAKELGRTTQFSASEAADGMSYLAMAGFETDEIISAMPGTLALAAAGQIELADAADIASNVLSGYGMEATDINRVNDALASGASNANTDISQLGDAMSYVAPVAHSSGIAFEEATAAIGKLSDAGIQGGRAGTTLRQIIASLENQTPKASEAIKRLGIETHDSEGNLRSITDITRQFEDAGLSTADAMTIFGSRAGPGMSALVGQGADALEELHGQIEGSGGAAQKMADRQMEGLNGALKELSSATEGAMIMLGEKLTPILEKVADALSGVVSWFGSLSDQQATFLAIGAALTAILLGVGGALLFILGMLPMLATGFGVLTGTVIPIVAPILAVIAAVAALALGIKYLWENSQTFRDIVMAVWEQVQAAAQAVVDWFMSEALPVLQDTWAQIQEVFESALDAIVGIVTWFVDVVQGFWDRFGKHIISAAKSLMKTLIGFFKGTWDNIKQVIDAVLRVIKGIFDVFAGIFTGDWSRLWGGIQQIFSGIWSAIHAIFSQIIQTIISVAKAAWTVLKTSIGAAMAAISQIWSGAWNAIKTFFETIWNGIKAFFGRIWSDIKTTVTGAINTVKDHISRTLSTIKELWSRAWASVKTALSNAWNRIVAGAQSGGARLLDFVRGLPGRILSGLGNIGSLLLGAGRDLIRGLINGIKNMAGAAVDAAKGAVSSAVQGAKNLLGIGSPSKVFMGIGQDTFEGMKLGMESMARDVGRAAETTAGAAIGPAQSTAALAGSSASGDTSYSRSERMIFNGDIILPNINDRSSADDLLAGLRQAVRKGA